MIEFRSAAVAAGALVVAMGLGACTTQSTDTEAASSPPAATQSETPTTSASSDDTKTPAKESEKEVAPGSYVDYADYVNNPDSYAETDVVLFFHATWCSTCHAAEQSIESTGVSDGLTIVKVDYDSSQDLKQQYGVTLQHTFVQIDEEGSLETKFVGQSSVDDIAAQLV
jgi:thiol-disulfide isomerase/thioredoxin